MRTAFSWLGIWSCEREKWDFVFCKKWKLIYLTGESVSIAKRYRVWMRSAPERTWLTWIYAAGCYKISGEAADHSRASRHSWSTIVATRKLFVMLTARYDSTASRLSVLWRGKKRRKKWPRGRWVRNKRMKTRVIIVARWLLIIQITDT
jgi:hypothetical protein